MRPPLAQARLTESSQGQLLYALLPWRTVIGNVLYGLEYQGVNAREARKRAGHFIEMVGLQGFEHHYPYELSGGMRLTGKMR